MTDFNATAAALLQAAKEYKGLKRNKNGKAHGSAMHPIRMRSVEALKAAGHSENEAYAMAWELSRKYSVI